MTEDAYSKRFIIDSISREGLVDLGFATRGQATAITDEQMTTLADGVGDEMSDGNDVYWETLEEAVKAMINL